MVSRRGGLVLRSLHHRIRGLPCLRWVPCSNKQTGLLVTQMVSMSFYYCGIQSGVLTI